MTTTTLIIIGTTAILCLVFFVILFILQYQKKILQHKTFINQKEINYQKKLVEANIEVAEFESEKIAKNIHDDIGTTLNVISLHLNRIKRNTNNEELVKELTNESRNLLDNAIDGIRNIAKDLMPPSLIKLGFEKGLIQLCRQIESGSSLKINLNQLNFTFSLPKKTELQLYRIVQETLNNIVKHANASHVNILIQNNLKSIIITITHNGIGINNEMVNELTKINSGIGLRSVQSRAQIINATIQYITISEKESIITIEIPKYETNN